MKKIFTAICLSAALATSAMAQVAQVITINGETVAKVATSLSFSGDNVIITFSDGSSQTTDMTAVSIIFTSTSALNEIEVLSYTGSADGVITISGIADGETVTVYDLGGHVAARATSRGGEAQLSLEGQKRGLYILRAGNKAVKLMKH